IVDEPDLEPLALPLTLTRPFEVDLHPGTVVAATPDPVLSSLVSHPTDQPRALAARVFAELTVLYLDAPGEARGAMVAVAPDAVADPAVWDPLLRDLARSG